MCDALSVCMNANTLNTLEHTLQHTCMPIRSPRKSVVSSDFTKWNRLFIFFQINELIPFFFLFYYFLGQFMPLDSNSTGMTGKGKREILSWDVEVPRWRLNLEAMVTPAVR